MVDRRAGALTLLGFWDMQILSQKTWRGKPQSPRKRAKGAK